MRFSMKFHKKVISHLNKCYSIAPFHTKQELYFLVAAEKNDPCYLFDTNGALIDTVWDGPGGVMSMVQLPGREDAFLATRRFYSPNDSADASIVVAYRTADQGWQTRTLCPLPFVHRFDIITAHGVSYLIACTLKSGHAHKDDWSSPGRVYAAPLPQDLSPYDEEHPLPLTLLKDGLLKNHGYFRMTEDGQESSLVSSESGIFHFIPPNTPGGTWRISQVLAEAASDAVLIDLDQDSEPELVTISPFHGDTITIYHRQDGGWKPVYTYPSKAEFSHAILAGTIGSVNAVIIGHRQGARDLLLFTYDKATSSYQYQKIDEDCGAANVMLFHDGTRQFLVAANREINEIALYEIESDSPTLKEEERKV